MAQRDKQLPCYGSCTSCGKLSYTTRRHARRAASRYPATDLRPYPCPAGHGWHLGHLAATVIHGHMSRTKRYRTNQPRKDQPVTTVKLVGKPSASAGEAIARHAQTLYDTPGSTRIGVIVLKRRFVTVPDPNEETEPTVHLGIAGLEIASPEQEETLRNALTVLKLHRSAEGTLFDDAEGIVGIELGPGTLEAVAGQLDRAETARLRVGLAHWADQARRVLHTPDLNLIEARHELDALATGLEALLLLGRAVPE